MPKHSISKLFSRSSSRKSAEKTDAITVKPASPSDAVAHEKDVSKAKGEKKKGKARRALIGFFKKGIPCTSSRGHAIELDQVMEEVDDSASDISAISFCDVEEIHSAIWDNNDRIPAQVPVFQNVVEQTHVPVKEVATPFVDVDVLYKVMAQQCLASVIEDEAAVIKTVGEAKVRLVEDFGSFVSDTVSIQLYDESEDQLHEESEDDIDSIINGYYATSLADKGRGLYGFTLPSQLADVVAYTDPFEDQLAKPALKVSAFGTIPLLNQNLIDEFIKVQATPRRKQRVVYEEVLHREDTVLIVSEGCLVASVDAEVYGSRPEHIDADAGSSDGSNACPSPLVDSSPSESSSSLYTPAQTQDEYTSGPSETELSIKAALGKNIKSRIYCGESDIDFDVASTSTPVKTPLPMATVASSSTGSSFADRSSCLLNETLRNRRRLLLASRPSRIPVWRRPEVSHKPRSSPIPILSPAHIAMRRENTMYKSTGPTHMHVITQKIVPLRTSHRKNLNA